MKPQDIYLLRWQRYAAALGRRVYEAQRDCKVDRNLSEFVQLNAWVVGKQRL